MLSVTTGGSHAKAVADQQTAESQVSQGQAVAQQRIGHGFGLGLDVGISEHDIHEHHIHEHHEHHEHHDQGYWKKKVTWKEGWKKIWNPAKKQIWNPSWKKVRNMRKVSFHLILIEFQFGWQIWKPHWVKVPGWKEIQVPAWKQIWVSVPPWELRIIDNLLIPCLGAALEGDFSACMEGYTGSRLEAVLDTRASQGM